LVQLKLPVQTVLPSKIPTLLCINAVCFTARCTATPACRSFSINCFWTGFSGLWLCWASVTTATVTPRF